MEPDLEAKATRIGLRMLHYLPLVHGSVNPVLFGKIRGIGV